MEVRILELESGKAGVARRNQSSGEYQAPRQCPLPNNIGIASAVRVIRRQLPCAQHSMEKAERVELRVITIHLAGAEKVNLGLRVPANGLPLAILDRLWSSHKGLDPRFQAVCLGDDLIQLLFERSVGQSSDPMSCSSSGIFPERADHCRGGAVSNSQFRWKH